MKKQDFEQFIMKVAGDCKDLANVLEDILNNGFDDFPTPAAPKPIPPTIPKELENETWVTANPNIQFHPFIASFLVGEKYTDTITTKDLKELKSYAFIEVHSISDRGVVFTFLGAVNKKICVQKYYAHAVKQFIEPGFYLVYSDDNQKPSYWVMAYKIATEERAYRLCKGLAKEFAIAKLNAVDITFKGEKPTKQIKTLTKKLTGTSAIKNGILKLKK